MHIKNSCGLSGLASIFNLPTPFRARSKKGQTNTKNVHTIASFSHYLFIYIYCLKEANAAFSSVVNMHTSWPSSFGSLLSILIIT